jgi:hypothetical protein
MSDTNRLKVSEMDFDTIKADLKTFMKEQDTFQDYNFEGSALSSLLDVMAYVTHYNAINANFAINETFLDSARLRPSVVSHAKMLGYTPRSSYPAVAYIDVKVNSPTGVLSDDNSYLPLTMNKGTVFTSTIDGVSYKFVNDQTLTTTIDANGEYIFSNVRILQGSYKTTEYVFDKDSAEAYLIPFENAVTSELTVKVQASDTNTAQETFDAVVNVTEVTATSQVYFLEESRTGVYEVKFGDGVLGQKLDNGNIIQLETLVTDNDAANGAAVFAMSGTIQGNTNVTLTVNQKAQGGSTKEDVESIKFNAPLSFVSQNRAVTPDDYKTIIQNNYANIDAITVWGGEDNDPPDYGKVYISIKPKDAEVVTEADKTLIISQYLKPKNVVSITPEIVDPKYTYIYLDVYFKYNPNVTALSADALEEQAREVIRTYNNDQLKRFDGVFRYSNVISKIDASSVAILNSIVRVKMKKRIVPTSTAEAKYDVVFSSPIYNTNSNEQIIKSSEFVHKGNIGCTLRDRVNDDGERRLQIVKGSGLTESVIENNAGTINVTSGKLSFTATIDSFTGTYIEITADPDSNDLAPKRNELLTILVDECTLSGEVDTMITGGTSAGVNYSTTARHD